MGTVRDITVEQAAARAAAGALVLDVREPAEWAEGHLAGATLIPLGELDASVIPRGREIIAVCRSGNRSSHAAAVLADAGHDVVNMAGGMVAWVRAGLPIVTSRTTRGAD